MNKIIRIALSYLLSNLDDVNETLEEQLTEKEIKKLLELAEFAEKNPSGFEGRMITEAGPMSAEEMKREGWNPRQGRPVMLLLDDGTLLYPSRDDEGNGPGAMFGRSKDGTELRFV